MSGCSLKGRSAQLKAPSLTHPNLCRLWVLRGQRQGQHQRQADFRAPGGHHLRKDVREPGRRRSRRHRGQAGAPADGAAGPSSPGLCMLKMTPPPASPWPLPFLTPQAGARSPGSNLYWSVFQPRSILFWWPRSDRSLRGTRTGPKRLWGLLFCFVLFFDCSGCVCLWIHLLILIFPFFLFSNRASVYHIPQQTHSNLSVTAFCFFKLRFPNFLSVCVWFYVKDLNGVYPQSAIINPLDVYGALIHVSRTSWEKKKFISDTATRKSHHGLIGEKRGGACLKFAVVCFFLFSHQL